MSVVIIKYSDQSFCSVRNIHCVLNKSPNSCGLLVLHVSHFVIGLRFDKYHRMIMETFHQ